MIVMFDNEILKQSFVNGNKIAFIKHLRSHNNYGLKEAKEQADAMFEAIQIITGLDYRTDIFTKEQYNKLAELADKLELERDAANLLCAKRGDDNTVLSNRLIDMFEVVQNLAKHLANE